MRDPEQHELIEGLIRELTDESRGIFTGSPAAAVLVVAAVLAAATEDLPADALRVATSTADRQFVAIATAFLAGDHERVDALARDHLTDHPSRPVLDWIVTQSRSAAANPSPPPTPTHP